ncbi:hypothetical protein BKH46_06105 [Helicobacter sp. 12S02634-8]|uniref:response regulator n=1 Tax=Helicobacter sp. 12S02634-8 TaxID=1476199 RepID=UPI000BA77E3C|nr:response regulator [Helicobacter sp. 12S02634-8]PAF46790.1 hypothetical protein BKH46_06105 [Helicobacter sp. 12S02634-8]
MNILIIENETYLAQSIASKLADIGHECHITSIMDSNTKNTHDVILISSSICGDHYEKFIHNHADAIIIMMISYVSDDTVSKPIKAGAKDYILKPFMIDELIRKIEHYRSCKDIATKINFYSSYFNFIEKELNTPTPFPYTPPFVIKSNSQRSADIYAMKYAREKNIHFEFYTLKEDRYKNILKNPPSKSTIIYITNLEELKRQERKDFLEIALKYSMIISLVSTDKIIFPQIIDISHIPNNHEIGAEILSVKEYEKAIIAKFEGRYPDIELAKKLGMSRKSLWEKRKKYGISRKK